MVSSETWAFFILLITLDRFLVVKFSFGQVRISSKTALVISLLCWVSGVIIGTIPLFFQSWEIYSTSGMCLGLPLTTQRPPGHQYSLSVFIGLNFILFLFISIGNYMIYKTKSDSQSSVMVKLAEDQARKRFKEDLAMAKHLSLIAASDFLCWCPICVMGLLALGGHEISHETYALAAVVIMPINSAINPLLYTVPAIMKKWASFKERVFEIIRKKETNSG